MYASFAKFEQKIRLDGGIFTHRDFIYTKTPSEILCGPAVKTFETNFPGTGLLVAYQL